MLKFLLILPKGFASFRADINWGLVEARAGSFIPLLRPYRRPLFTKKKNPKKGMT